MSPYKQTDTLASALLCSHLHTLTHSLTPSHPHSLTPSLPHTSTHRTVITVIELLAAVCLVKGGHGKIMEAVNNFKKANGEFYRFEKLVHFFMEPTTQADFQVACRNFINVIVHSAEDMNFRVHLQHEFTLLGLDEFLEVGYVRDHVTVT